MWILCLHRKCETNNYVYLCLNIFDGSWLVYEVLLSLSLVHDKKGEVRSRRTTASMSS